MHSALPEQHEDQLQLGFRMIEKAYGARVHSLEQERKSLQVSCEEQKQQAAGLQRKNSALEVELAEGHSRSQQLSDENKELFKTVQSLRKQLVRLEGLKKKVLESISDETAEGYEAEDSYGRGRRDEDSYRQSNYALPGTLPSYNENMSSWPGSGQTPQSHNFGQQQDAGACGGLGAYSPYGQPPAVHEPVAAAAAPAQGGVVDGKAFFRQARNCLSYEAFNNFLASIKRLNNQQQTREETLEQARGIFGNEQRHLYKEFEELLNRHAIM